LIHFYKRPASLWNLMPYMILPHNMEVKKHSSREKDLGNAAYKLKNFAKAISHYEAAIQLDPSETTFHSNLTAVYYEQQEFDKCVEVCEAAVRLGRENGADSKLIAKVLNRAGNAHRKLGNLQAAKEAFQQAVAEVRSQNYELNLSEVEAAIIEVDKSQKTSEDALVEVRPVDGKGFGLVTTQPVKAGTKMLAEKPLLILKRRHKDLDRVSFAEITSVFNSLDSEKQARLLELQASAAPAALSQLQCEGEMGKLLHNYNSVKESTVYQQGARVTQIFNANHVRVGEDENWVTSAVFEMYSRVNHSCRPNSTYKTLAGETGCQMVVTASQDLPANTELTINYIPTFQGGLASRADRRQRLQSWEFHCSCCLCSLAGQDLQQNEETRTKLRHLHSQVLPTFKGLPKKNEEIDFGMKAFKALSEFISLMEAIRYETLEQLPFYYKLISNICHMIQRNGGNPPHRPDHFKAKALEVIKLIEPDHSA